MKDIKTTVSSFDEDTLGEKGWSPLIRAVPDGERKVLELYSWVGGEGSPPSETGYLGATGLVSNITNGVDIQGDSYVPEFDNIYFDL